MMISNKRQMQIIATLSLFSSAFAAGTRAGTSSSSTESLIELSASSLSEMFMSAQEGQRKRLKHKEVTLSAWNSHNGTVRPLDLRIDQDDPTKVYQVDANGFLQPMGDENYQEEYEEVVHISDERVNSHELVFFLPPEGNEERILEDLKEAVLPSKLIQLDSPSNIFKYTEEDDPYTLQVEDAPSYLQKKKKKDKDKKSKDKKSKDKKSKGNSSENKEKKIKGNSSSSSSSTIRSTFPPKNTKVGNNEAFGALCNASAKSVCVQLRDHSNTSSECYNAVHVGFDIWEITFDGFDDYEGKTWSYRVQGTDKSNAVETTEWVDFVVNVSGGDKSPGTGKKNGGGDSSKSKSNISGNGKKLTETVSDDSWPYGGVIQRSTGRILFFFSGNAFVCTGTVMDDKVQDRTVILTAAHCAWEYGKGFADHALFIPDQDSTTGADSDQACSNDPFGCWIPAFVVVDKRWTRTSFPDTAPYDYAFYVIPNEVDAHEKGFKHYEDPGLSELLPELTEPIPVDWNYSRKGEFITGLGYSFDKDPDFRYCSGTISGRRGLPTYENLWVGVCEMTGGSSGGPWMVDTDEDGRGTVISVNSWGFPDSPGMAGPDLSTGEAKCLYERAKTRSLSSSGGYIVDDC